MCCLWCTAIMHVVADGGTALLHCRVVFQAVHQNMMMGYTGTAGIELGWAPEEPRMNRCYVGTEDVRGCSSLRTDIKYVQYIDRARHVLMQQK
jgi:hypothetical protein